MERQENLKAILFDFDGTLFELAVDWDQVRHELKDLLDYPGPAKDFKPLRPKVQEITSGDPGREQQAYEIISHYEIEGAKNGRPHEGAREILDWCRKKNIKIVILTRNTKDCVFPVIKEYRWPQPELIVAREDVEKEKPDPESGLLVLEKLRLQPQECLIVGDSLPDLELAKNLGITSVLYRNPRHEIHPKEHADYFIKNIVELRGILS